MEETMCWSPDFCPSSSECSCFEMRGNLNIQDGIEIIEIEDDPIQEFIVLSDESDDEEEIESDDEREPESIEISDEGSDDDKV